VPEFGALGTRAPIRQGTEDFQIRSAREEPNANHSAESWGRRLPAAITFLYGDSRTTQ